VRASLGRSCDDPLIRTLFLTDSFCLGHPPPQDLARIIEPAPNKPKTAAKSGSKKTAAAGKGNSAGGKGAKGAEPGAGKGMKTEAPAATGDAKSVGIAIAVALFAVFIAKVAAGFIFQ